MNLKFIKSQNLGSLLMKSSQSNFDLRSPSSFLVRSYITNCYSTKVCLTLGQKYLMINGSIYEGYPFKILFISVLQIMFFVFFQLRKFDWPWGQKYIKDTGWLMDQFFFHICFANHGLCVFLITKVWLTLRTKIYDDWWINLFSYLFCKSCFFQLEKFARPWWQKCMISL